MPGIKLGSLLTCDSLSISFYDQCSDPPVLKDPYEIYYSISKISPNMYASCSMSRLSETIESEPLKAGIGKYYVPELPPYLEPGKYKVHWAYRESEECTFSECCQEFTIYKEYCYENRQGLDNPCICF